MDRWTQKRYRDIAPRVLDPNRMMIEAALAHNAPPGLQRVWKVDTFKLIAHGGAARYCDGNPMFQ